MTIPKYQINLNLPPEERWIEVATDFKKEIYQLSEEIKNILGMLDSSILFMIRKAGTSVINYFRNNNKLLYCQELESISKITKVPFEDLVLSQIIYEFCSACSSVVYKANDGQIVCLRTMDWDMPELKNITINLDFIKDGQVIYSATSWAGMVGLFTVVKKDVGSIALNYRKSNGNLLGSIKRLIYDYHFPTGYMIREVIEQASKPEELLEWSKNTQLVSPCYLILGLPDTGYVIEREPTKIRNIYQIGKYNPKYLIQTNHDQDKDDADNIFWSYQRRDILDKKIMPDLIQLSSEHATSELFDKFLSGYVKNKYTIYISHMIVSKGKIESKIVR